MSPKQPEQGFYVEVNQEDLRAVDVLRGQHPGNLDTSLPIGPPQRDSNKKSRHVDGPDTLHAEAQVVVRAKNEESESGNALELPFDRDVVMVNLPKDTPEHGLDSHLESPTPKQLPVSVYDDEPIFEARQTQATLGTSSAPITVELLPAEDPLSTAPLPDLSGSDLDVLKALVEYSVKYWPNKNFDHFLPGRFVPEWVLMELLRIDLPGQYTLGVPPNRISKLSKACVGTVLPYHVNDVNQLSEIANEKNHFLIAIINTADKTFTSWGMRKAMERKSKSAYEKALGFDLLGISSAITLVTAAPFDVLRPYDPTSE
ncbi:hypothetical protein F5883DRAFT_620661 [Diaporthe sp. PMI_573]|nr:hypothetical protein F5883DRAFT_620661 [Diaporthaceae sp. PMI_573]